jgi:2OG-Fe(II) oxygenase superfamily.
MPDADGRNIAHNAPRRKDRQIMTQYYFDTRCHNLPLFSTSSIGKTSLVLFLIVVVFLHPSCFIFDDDHNEEGGERGRVLLAGVVGAAHAFPYSYIILFPSGNPAFHNYNKRRPTQCDYFSLLRWDDRYSTTTTTSKLFSCTSRSTSTSSRPTTSSSTAAADDNTTTTTTATTASATHQALNLGPPEPLKSLQIGQQLVAFRTKLVNNKENHSASTTEQISSHSSSSSNFTIERVSYTPDAFLFRNFLTPYECSLIQSTAQDIGMAPAETITHNDTTSRKNCTVAWLSPALSTAAATTTVTNTTTNCSRLISNLLSCTANILLSKNILSNPSAGVEDLQVLRYGIGGEFVLHHDGEPRVVTVIYYLNGVGGTWFPLARTSNPATQKEQDAAVGDGWSSSQNDLEEEDEMLRMEKQFYKVRQKQNVPWNKKQALDLKQGYQPGTHGLLVQGMSSQTSFFSNHPGHQQQTNIVNNNTISDHNSHIAWVQQGDALAFYNYHPSTADHENDTSLLSLSSLSSSGTSTNTTSQKLDWRALHCGLPITEQQEGEKWIANHWFRVNDLLLE